MAHLSHHHAYSGQHVYSGGKSKENNTKQVSPKLEKCMAAIWEKRLKQNFGKEIKC